MQGTAHHTSVDTSKFDFFECSEIFYSTIKFLINIILFCAWPLTLVKVFNQEMSSFSTQFSINHETFCFGWKELETVLDALSSLVTDPIGVFKPPPSPGLM